MRVWYVILLVGSLAVLQAVLAPAVSAAPSYPFEWALPSGTDVQPFGIAVDSTGMVYATETRNDSVWKYTADGIFQSRWGSQGAGAGMFDQPSGIAVNSTGFIYIADTGNDRIQVLAPSGTPVTRWGSAGANTSEFRYPMGVALLTSGSVFVADTENHRIQVFNPSGSFYNAWNRSGGGSGSGNGEFFHPEGIAVNSSGLVVYVSDTGNHRIQAFTTNGVFITAWNKSGGGSGSGNGEFSSPADVAVNSSGYVFVMDSGNHRVQVFYPNGTYRSKFGSYGSESGYFRYPSRIAVNSTGFIYVADEWNHRVQVFDRNGAFVRQWGSGGNADGKFITPYGIAVNSSGYLHVADTGNYRVQILSRAGAYAGKFGSRGYGDGQFVMPSGIATNSSGYIYVTDPNAQRIQVFTRDGIWVQQWNKSGGGDGEFSNPFGIAVNSSGYVYVADTNNHRVQVFTRDGIFVRAWNRSGGGSGSGNGEFYFPSAVACDDRGHVFVADKDNNRVQYFDPGGTYLGQWGSTGTGNGSFIRPLGIAADASGSVYVADADNDRIQKFSLPGNTSLIGVFRNSTHLFYLDWNGNGAWNGALTDKSYSFGITGDIPITGDWNNDGKTEIGVFRPSTHLFYLDWNGNGAWNGALTDKSYSFGITGDIPITGDWNNDGRTEIGIFRPSTHLFYLDWNGNGAWNGALTDKSYNFGITGDIPITGDWNSDGATEIGVFRPSTHLFYLDWNGNGAWNGALTDKSYTFGISGDTPVTGDWTGDGSTKIGIFRPSTHLFYLDWNGNGAWNGALTDKSYNFGITGDTPVTGAWS